MLGMALVLGSLSDSDRRQYRRDRAPPPGSLRSTIEGVYARRVQTLGQGVVSMRQRRLLLTGLTAALILVVAVGVRARISQYTDRPLNRQNLGLISNQTTSSTSWADVSGWGISDGPFIQARGGLAATLSVTVSGAPVRFRFFLEVVDRDFRVRLMVPKSAAFNPGAGNESFSYTFVSGGLHRGRYTVNLQWSSPTGAPVTLSSGSVVLQYASAA